MTRSAIWAFSAWRRAAGPFGRFVFAAPFFGNVRVAARPAPGKRPPRLPRALGVDPPAPDDAILLDLEPVATLAALLARPPAAGRIIPLIARWPASPAVLPVEELWSILIDRAPGPVRRRASAGPPYFVLDGARAGPARGVGPPTLARRFDNRYAYQIDYLPPPAFLLAAGCRRVVWLSPDGVPAEDLGYYEERLVRGGLALDHRATRPLRSPGAAARPNS